MRYTVPSTGSVQHPVFIFDGYSEHMEQYLDTRIGLWRRIKLKFMFQVACRFVKDYTKQAAEMQNSFFFWDQVSLNRMLWQYFKKCKVDFKCFAT